MHLSRILAGACAAGLAAAAAQSAAATPVGTWVTEGGWATVRVAACPSQPDRLCGWITALKQPNDPKGRPKRDTANVDPALRSRPIVGMPFVTGFKAARPGRWTGGRIYNPGDGKTYASNLVLNADGTLKVNGCVLVVCKAQTWTRAGS
jgi:uncharacterized protein (DUF2147 family)